MRILGVDVGSKSIKAVELDSAFGRFEIRDYHELKIPSTDSSESPSQAVPQALAQLLANLPRRPDRIAVGLRSGVVTFRNLQIPAKGKKAIQAAVGFELEDELPFPMDQCVYDYSVLSQVKQVANVHVAATLTRHLASCIDFWNNSGIDPDLITSEPWAYRALLNRIVPPAQGPGDVQPPVLLVQLGDQRTVLYLQHNGAPTMAREIDWGGRDLTATISKRYTIPLDQAEQAKLDHGFVIAAAQRDQATPEQIEFSDMLARPLQTLIRELHQAILTCKNVTKEQLGTIYLSGGGALLPGLARYLEEKIGVTVRPLQALNAISTSGVTYSEQTDATFSQCIAYGLCLVGQERAAAINFRKNGFAKAARGKEFDRTLIRKVLLASGAVAASLLASLIVQSQVYSSRLKDVDVQLEKSVKGFFGQISSSAVRTYLASPSTLRSSINKELNKQRDLFKLLGPNPRSPLDYLRDLSMTVPKDVVVDVTQFQIGAAPTAPYSISPDSSVSLTLQVANPQVAEKVASLLTPKVTGMQRGKMEEVTAPDGTSKRWKITFSGKPAEDAYGK